MVVYVLVIVAFLAQGNKVLEDSSPWPTSNSCQSAMQGAMHGLEAHAEVKGATVTGHCVRMERPDPV